jgi:hypothetical protein
MATKTDNQEHYIIFFGNSKVLDGSDKECSCYGEMTCFAVFDALCMKFLRVTAYKESDGSIFRDYNNT